MAGGTDIAVRLLGPLALERGGVAIALPRSRKVRVLLGYLALADRPVSRSRLCDLLWDVPNDPRGELRWCLSKLRAALGPRVVTTDDQVALDLDGVAVDAVDIARALEAGLDGAPLDQLCDQFRGELLEGVDAAATPELAGWLAGQRARFRAMHVAVLHALATRATAPAEAFRRLQAWLALAPFDLQAHGVMLDALVRAGRLRDAEDHVTATIRAFEAEGLDWSALRERWKAARGSTPRIEVAEPPPPARQRQRASIAVMPFTDRAGSIGEGLTEDIIVQLAKLRLLFVIARGSVFALAERGIAPHDAARVLDVDYIVTGSVRRDGPHAAVTAELSDARDARIVWTETFDGIANEVPASIVQRIVAAIAEEIESAEARRAVLKPAASLDAWEAYHRGLWHMYKFTGPDNRHAQELFRASIGLDPTFSRAHAGLSFTHFQNAFLDLTQDHDHQVELAYQAAIDSLGADDHDPAAHWAMGRALWLRGDQRDSLAELERSIALSPNFALGHYTLGFVHSQKGDPHAAIESTNYSRQLSPFDPLQFAMLASRAMAHVRIGERAEAAEWAVKATARPNAHTHILAIAAECLALVNRRDEARRYVARIRERVPSYSVEHFLRAFHFDDDTAKLFRRGARAIGFDR